MNRLKCDNCCQIREIGRFSWVQALRKIKGNLPVDDISDSEPIYIDKTNFVPNKFLQIKKFAE